MVPLLTIETKAIPNGPVLVLMHGGLASLHTWEGWVKALGQDYRIISMDLPAHGLTGRIPGDDYNHLSMAKFVKELVGELGVDSFVVAGNSMGGGVALTYTLEYPDDVKATVLIASGGVVPEEGFATTAITPDINEEPPSGDIGLLEKIGANLMSPSLVRDGLTFVYYNDDLITDQLVEQYANLLRHNGNRHALMVSARDGGEKFLDLEHRLHEVKVPVLLMHGRHDDLVKMNVAEIFQAGLPYSELVVYENSGHIPMEEEPEKTATDLVKFLQTHNLVSTTTTPESAN